LVGAGRGGGGLKSKWIIDPLTWYPGGGLLGQPNFTKGSGQKK